MFVIKHEIVLLCKPYATQFFIMYKSKRVIPFTCWAFKLKLKSWIVIQDWLKTISNCPSVQTIWKEVFHYIQIKRRHSIHVSSIEIDTKDLELVICYKFNNNKLSFFTSHTKLSFPICTLLNMKLFFFASHIKCSFSLCINLKESVSPFTCWIFKLILKTWFVIQYQFQYQILLLYSIKGSFPLCSNQRSHFIHMSSKGLELVIHYQFNNIKLSFFTSHTSFPLCILKQMLYSY